jgi:hypothetical protein
MFYLRRIQMYQPCRSALLPRAMLFPRAQLSQQLEPLQQPRLADTAGGAPPRVYQHHEKSLI